MPKGIKDSTRQSIIAISDYMRAHANSEIHSHTIQQQLNLSSAEISRCMTILVEQHPEIFWFRGRGIYMWRVDAETPAPVQSVFPIDLLGRIASALEHMTGLLEQGITFK